MPALTDVLPESLRTATMPADPIAAVVHRDPYPWYRDLAATRPFYFDATLKLWVTASAAAVAEVLDHPAARVRPASQPVPPALAGGAAGDLFGRLVRMTDGPAHAALKSIVLRRLAALDLGLARVRAHALATALPRMTDDDAHEANRWMFTLPVLAMADLLGLPLERDDAGHVATRVAGFVATFATAMSPLATPAEVQAGAAAAQWLGECVAACEPSAPDGSLLQALSRDAALAGIDRTVLIANAVGLMIQACEATAGLVGNTLVSLGRSGRPPGDIDIDARVAQVARMDPPVQNTRRFMAADATLCGQPVRANDAVLVLLAGAAHDPAGDPAADVAPGNRAWTFGAGRHGCPGDALARVLAACTVQALLGRGLQPARLADGVRYRPSVNARIPQFAAQPA
ncbi:cytochrome P450 [Cupriavidus pauculus]|uniref:cytochrome P450 n=1 Tax=Cupriavidus pauculus TaxID=82633 RepID=UPI001EE2A11F|nr:cytochrome P450 [Cupriavidus pauculus]GJG94900.1 cytochrome P450 [Cupriavidus pauculus]